MSSKVLCGGGVLGTAGSGHAKNTMRPRTDRGAAPVKGKLMKLTALIFALGTTTAVSLAGVTTTVDFEDGLTHGWEGPQGIGGSTYIDNTGGNGGGAGYRTQFNNFGIDFRNNTNSAFIGDFTGFDEVTVSFDLKVDQIGTFLPVSRPFVLEMRSTTLASGGYPWASAYFLFDWYGQDSFDGYTTLSTTFDPNAVALPAGWGGYGAEDPVTFEPMLPDGVTYADIMANVDEMAITTLLPGYFFSFDDYDFTLDNISISTVPAPSALALIGLGGMVGTRRRR